MFCPNCGNQLSDEARFCSNCGWSRKDKEQKSLNVKTHVNIKKIIISVLSVLTIVIGLVAYNLPKARGKVYEFFDLSEVKVLTEYKEDSLVESFDTVKFGTYPQSDETGVIKEPIEWLVLERNEEKREALLLSKYIIDCRYYNNVQTDVTWETSTIRNYLNTYFANLAFNSKEQSLIINKLVVNDTSDYGGLSTFDNLFCLSIDEINEYFGKESAKRNAVTKGTKFAKSVVNNFKKMYVADYDKNSYYYGASEWWLRSPGTRRSYAAYIQVGGVINVSGDPVKNIAKGVRPAMWVSY